MNNGIFTEVINFPGHVFRKSIPYPHKFKACCQMTKNIAKAFNISYCGSLTCLFSFIVCNSEKLFSYLLRRSLI